MQSSAWNDELRQSQCPKGKQARPPSLLRAIIQVFGRTYAFFGFFCFMEECFIRLNIGVLFSAFLYYRCSYKGTV